MALPRDFTASPRPLQVPPRNFPILFAGAPRSDVSHPMTPDVLLALTLGGSIGSANAAASYGLYRLARGREDRVFYSIVLLGMLGRMGVALVLVTVVIGFLPVHLFAFISALLVSVGAGLAIETFLIYRDPETSVGRAAASPRTSL